MHAAMVEQPRIGFELFPGILSEWVTYDGPTRRWSVFLGPGIARPAQPLLTHEVDLAAALRGQGYFGVAASTGASFARHDLLAWQVSFAT